MQLAEHWSRMMGQPHEVLRLWRFAGTPFEESKRKAMIPALYFRVVLWTLQTLFNGTPAVRCCSLQLCTMYTAPKEHLMPEALAASLTCTAHCRSVRHRGG